MQVDEQTFSIKDFRRLLDVPDGKLERFPDLNRYAVKSAVLEVNALSDFNVEIEALREGGMERGKLKGFRLRWERKSKDEWKAVLNELTTSKTGRKARITGTVEEVVF